MTAKVHANHGRDHGPDGMDWGRFGLFQVIVFEYNTAVSTGDAKKVIGITSDLDNSQLVRVVLLITKTASSSGLPTVQIRNITQAHDMLTTKVSCDVSEFTSETATTAPVINEANSLVATGDRLAIDVDIAGSGTTGMNVMLGFS